MNYDTRQLIEALMGVGYCPDDRIDREMLQEATAVFGDAAQHWLTTPCMALNQQRPIDLINRGKSNQVRVILVRLAYGVYT